MGQVATRMFVVRKSSLNLYGGDEKGSYVSRVKFRLLGWIAVSGPILAPW
jgi:hypothetical protein